MVSRILEVKNIPLVENNNLGLINRIFNLFSHYGCVKGIKILKSNMTSCLIEFSDNQYA